MSIKGQVIVILLCFAISFLYIRGFLYGAIRHQINNSAYKKRKKGQTFKEWLLFSRCKEEIPKILLILYYLVLLMHFTCVIICVFLHIVKLSNNVGEILVKGVACFDAAWIVIIALLFWSPGRDYAYERWITKKRGQQKGK